MRPSYFHSDDNLVWKEDEPYEIYDNYVEDIGEQENEIGKFLHQQLERLGEDRFKDMYITIQKEQNEIIRMPTDKHLVIQGGAGTGKTIFCGDR